MSSTKIMLDGNWQPRGYEQITNLTTAVDLKIKGRAAIIQAEGDNIRWRDDGIDPTSSVGMLLPDGADIFYTGNLYAIKFIETTGSGVLNISYYETPDRQV